MNLAGIFLAAIAAFVAYMALAFALLGLFPSLKIEFLKYPAVYRDEKGQMSHMSVAMPAMLLSLHVLTVLYSFVYQGGSGFFEGARLGALIGLFAIGAFVLHNYANLNIGLKLALQQCLTYFLEWQFVGIVIGLIYWPSLPR